MNYEFYLKVTDALKQYVLKNPNLFNHPYKIMKAFGFSTVEAFEVKRLYVEYKHKRIDLRRFVVRIFIIKYWKDSMIFTNYNGDTATTYYILETYVTLRLRIHNAERAYALEKFMAR